MERCRWWLRTDSRGLFITRCRITPKVAMDDNRRGTLAMSAPAGLDFGAQVQAIQRIGFKKANELHRCTLAHHASPHYARLSQVTSLNKTGLSVFHGPNMPSPTTVQTSLNNKKPSCRTNLPDSRRDSGKPSLRQLCEKQPDSSDEGLFFTPTPSPRAAAPPCKRCAPTRPTMHHQQKTETHQCP
jgi:hypothetical protein